MAKAASTPPVPVTAAVDHPVPLYNLSSQYRNWRYSKTELNAIRQELNVKAVERVKSMVEEERAEPIASTSTSTPTSTTTSRSASPLVAPAAAEIQYLTIIDELSLVTYYLSQFGALCKHFQFPEMVQASAMTYLKRFYLRNTCMDYHPKSVMLTCVFLASKTENHCLSIDTFSSNMKTTPDEILNLEFLVSQSLKFEYKVHHAHLAAKGLFLDLQTVDVPYEMLEEANKKVEKLLAVSRLTDVEFIYTPSQIALAAFWVSSPSIVEKWLGVKEGRREEKGKGVAEEGSLEVQALLDLLSEIGGVLEKAAETPVDKEAVTEVDRRLRWARNPEKDPKSALFKKRKAEEEAERTSHALAKAAKLPVENDDDVFG